MLYDQLRNAACYRSVHDAIAAALDVLKAYDPASFQPGRRELDGEQMYLMQLQYETAPAAGKLLEAHRKYIDVMYMLDGEEEISFKPTDTLRNICRPYDAAEDALLAAPDDDMSTLRLQKGQFAVFFPQDAHRPGGMLQAPKTVRRLVVKVRVDLQIT